MRVAPETATRFCILSQDSICFVEKIGIATKGVKNPRLFVSLSAMKWGT
jgi:hypothetical protein